MQDQPHIKENQMSKPTTDQPNPFVVAGEATEITETAPVAKKGRIRRAASKVGTFVKEHKSTVIATVGLGALVGGSAYLGRKTAPSNDSQPETPVVDYDDELAELTAMENDTQSTND